MEEGGARDAGREEGGKDALEESSTSIGCSSVSALPVIGAGMVEEAEVAIEEADAEGTEVVDDVVVVAD